MFGFISRQISGLKRTAHFLTKAAQTGCPRLAYVGGWLGYHNLGDEALLAAYRKLFPDYALLVYGADIPKAALRISRWTHLCGAGVLGGGTLIGRLDAGLVSPILEALPVSFVFGTGVANPAFWSPRDSSFHNRLEQWRPVLQRCHYIGVRGPMSAQLLGDIGLSNVEVIGDPVLVFADKNCAAATGSGVPSLGLNVGQSKGLVWGNEESMCAQFVELAKAARRAGWDVHWVVVWEEDLETTLRVAEASGTADRIYQIYDDHLEFLDWVRLLTVFVGMKLHAVVLATCAYVPSVMVEYRPKCRDYMRSINQEDATIRSDEFDGVAAWDMVKSWASRRLELSRRLYADIQPLAQIQRTKAKEIAQRLMNAGDLVPAKK
jgi:hypothetical protein